MPGKGDSAVMASPYVWGTLLVLAIFNVSVLVSSKDGAASFSDVLRGWGGRALLEFRGNRQHDDDTTELSISGKKHGDGNTTFPCADTEHINIGVFIFKDLKDENYKKVKVSNGMMYVRPFSSTEDWLVSLSIVQSGSSAPSSTTALTQSLLLSIAPRLI